MTSGSGNNFGKVGSYSVQGMNIRFTVPDSISLNHCLHPTARVRTPKMQASPPTRQPSKHVLLIKCLELDVVIGVAIRPEPIMPFFLPIMLFCNAHFFYLLCQFKYLLCSKLFPIFLHKSNHI